MKMIACGNRRERSGIEKTLLVMKLTAFFLLAVCLNVSAKGVAQTVSFSEKNVSLEKVFNQVKRQTGYTFVYREVLIKRAGKVSINFKDASVEQVMDVCLKDQPLTYSIVNKIVVIKEKEAVVKKDVYNASLFPPAIRVQGRITNEEGKPLAGTSVQSVGEVKFLRALMYMEMVKRYGGVPIADTVFPAGEQVNVPRSSFDSCIRFIVKDCNDAIASLPPAYAGAQTGHATALAAYALKAKALLFAASPQFNTATPYLNMPNAFDNRLICYGNYDVNRWKAAADAAKDALDYAAANGYGLIDVPSQRNPAIPAVGIGAPIGNYRNAWEVYNNKEIIMVYQGNVAINFFNPPLSLIIPTTFNIGPTWSGISVPLNFLKKYEDTLGNVVNWDGGSNDLLDKIWKTRPPL